MADILLIAPDRERASGLRGMLRQDGHRIEWVRTVQAWQAAERRVVPELIVAAVPSTDAVLTRREPTRRGFPAPMLFVQGETDFCRDLSPDDRFLDRILSPFMSEEFLARADALIRVRRVILRAAVDDMPRPTEDDETSADVPEHARGRLQSAFRRLAAVLGTRVPRFDRPLEPYLEVAARVAEWADARDGFDPGHAERVAQYCGMIADELGLGDGEATALMRAAWLHDIGKVALPAELLTKPGPLEQEQMRLLRTHAARGAALLRALDPDEDLARTILYHHEHVDGGGYFGKTHDEMPRNSRILAVAEAYDAMTHSRVRQPVDSPEALGILRDGRDRQFDADAVNALDAALAPRALSLPVSGLLGN